MKKRIMIIDDNAVNLQLARDVLENAGCTVATANDAQQALVLLAHSLPDLILMDIALPGMDGLALTRVLKADPRTACVPVVALTASAMLGDADKAQAAGCQGYVTKPIDTRRFAAQILAFISATPETAPAAAHAAAAGSAPVTLVVDDHQVNRNLLRAGLEAEGHVILEAANGVEALAVLERHAVDAVISDILMPQMDGFRLCREIRRSGGAYASVPFILYTSTYDSPSDRQLAEAVGANGYLLKPAPIYELLRALRDARAKPGVPDQASPAVTESYVLEQYNAALVHKLESRNAELQRANAELRDAHSQILRLNRDLEKRVEERTAALTFANQELEAFSYSVAHDLRAPLRHISGFATLAREDAAGASAEVHENLEKVHAAALRMDHLILELLAFSRMGRQELRLANVELEALADEAIALLQPDTGDRNIRWHRMPLHAVRGDPTLLRQVLVNLLSNAIKYTRDREEARIGIGCHLDEPGMVAVLIRDNGIGFDMRHAASLFGIFQRLHAGSRFEGTGVGLANVKRIVERHGGRVWAEGAVDRGATFGFSLPRAETA